MLTQAATAASACASTFAFAVAPSCRSDSVPQQWQSPTANMPVAQAVVAAACCRRLTVRHVTRRRPSLVQLLAVLQLLLLLSLQPIGLGRTGNCLPSDATAHEQLWPPQRRSSPPHPLHPLHLLQPFAQRCVPTRTRRPPQNPLRTAGRSSAGCCVAVPSDGSAPVAAPAVTLHCRCCHFDRSQYHYYRQRHGFVAGPVILMLPAARLRDASAAALGAGRCAITSDAIILAASTAHNIVAPTGRQSDLACGSSWTCGALILRP